MDPTESRMSGRLRKAPEDTLEAGDVERARRARRRFMGAALAMGAGTAASAAPTSGDGDPNILELPAHSKGLGLPVALTGYGSPSKWEKNIQRRPSPGLTQVAQASVSFCPLQSLFGIITPSGLHFER
ncbi:MAG: sulfite dehydrogenase, partial [Caldimonas sp.]